MSRRHDVGWEPGHAELLERGDPGAGSVDPVRRGARRARVLAAAGERRGGFPRAAWIPLAGLAAAALVAAVLLDRTSPATVPAVSRDAGAPATERPTPRLSRQVLFATPGGTRIVWVLQDQDPF